MLANTATPTGVSHSDYYYLQTSHCPSCESFVSAVDVQEATCPDCDVVVSESTISRDPEPMYSDDEESQRRTGAPKTSRRIGQNRGTELPEEHDKAWTKPWGSTELRIGYATSQIERIASVYDLPETEREHAARLYRRAQAEGHVAGRSIDGFAAACLLVAIRQNEPRQPVSERELLSVAACTKEQFRNARRELEWGMGEPVPPMCPRDYLPRFANEAKVPLHVEKVARSLLQAYRRNEECDGSSARTMAAVALAVALDECRTNSPVPTQSELAEVAGCSPSTVSSQKSILRPYIEELSNRE
jgi:transcription initiation factor TFIIB